MIYLRIRRYIVEDDWDGEDKNFDLNKAEQFELDLKSILNDLIAGAEILEEDFISKSCLQSHYLKHCLGKNKSKRSSKNRIYYDFNDASKYSQFEKYIDNKIKHNSNSFGTLLDYNGIIKSIRDLFGGDYVLEFCSKCGLTNNKGSVVLSLISDFNNDVTSNYLAGNVIHICVQTISGKTITIYPVDAHELQKEFNRILKKYANYSGPNFDWNR